MMRCLLIAALLLGCSKDPPKTADGLTTVRIQLNWVPEPEFGGIYAARDLGFYKAEGLEVEIIKGAAGVPAPQLAASGKVEFAVVGGDQIVTLRARGAPLVGVYSCFATFPRAIVVHQSSPHQTLEDLWRSDARVAIEPGLPFVRWLDAQYSGAALQRVPGNGGLAGFMGDKSLAQAVFAFAEPVELETRGVPTRIFRVADSGYDPYTAVIATNDAFSKANPKVVEQFVRATRKGWQAYLKDPGPTNAVMARLNPGMSKAAMDRGARLAEPYIRGAGGPLGQMSAARWSTLIDQLVKLGAVAPDKAPTADDCFRAL